MPTPLTQQELTDWNKLRQKGKAYIQQPNLFTGAITIATSTENRDTFYFVEISSENTNYIQFRRQPHVAKLKEVPTASHTEPFRLFIPKKKPAQTIGQQMERAGLKFHISLPDHCNRGTAGFEDEEVLRAKTWSIISKYLMQPGHAGVHAFKVLNPELRHTDMDTDYNRSTMAPNATSQYAKDVVVYARQLDNKTPEEWVLYMQKLSDELAEAGIPGHLLLPTEGPRKTTMLGNSPYVCFRLDQQDEEISKRIQKQTLKTRHFSKGSHLGAPNLNDDEKEVLFHMGPFPIFTGQELINQLTSVQNEFEAGLATGCKWMAADLVKFQRIIRQITQIIDSLVGKQAVTEAPVPIETNSPSPA